MADLSVVRRSSPAQRPRSGAPAARADGDVHAPDALDEAAARAFRLPFVPLLVALGTLVAVGLLSTAVGAAGLPVGGVITALLDRVPLLGVESTLSASEEAVLFSIRLPRLALGAVVGGCLALAGASFQGTFRNPLADPYLLGVSAGAGLGAVLALGFDLDLAVGPVSAVPAAAFCGALLAVAGSAVVSRGSFSDPATLLLAGVAMAALFSAAQTYAITQLTPDLARQVLSWLFGQLSTAGWDATLLVLPYLVVGGTVLLVHARHLDVLRLGDDEARALGLDPTRSRLVVVVAATLVTAAAVSVSGLIAFVGLVVPHLVRLLVGSSYRVVVPVSMIAGGAFLALVDVGARTLVAPAELPVGVITAFIGAPFFALVLMTRRRGGV
ncbi:iron ABC transporter permease [Nocardioidaceae bacterium]|nr:iron ABC transporter permease [Nocardioidaceae bacterium]